MGLALWFAVPILTTLAIICLKRFLPKNVYVALARTNAIINSTGKCGQQLAPREATKRPFSPDLVPDRPDMIVVGSGIGSLVTAAVAAKAGFKVLVLEQHSKAGGCCHSFKEKRHFEFDTGLHFVGRMSGEKNSLATTLNKLSCGNVVWASQGQNYDVITVEHEGKTRTFKIHVGRFTNESMFLKEFPHEGKAIRQFFDDMFDRRPRTGWVLAKVLPLWLVKTMYSLKILDPYSKVYKEHSTMSCLEGVNRLTKDPLLRLLMLYIIPAIGFGLDSTYMMLLETWRHYIMDGCWYPKGGSAAIVQGLVPTITSAGGAVLCRASVTEIMVNEKGTAYGVKVCRTKKGEDTDKVGTTGKEYIITAPIIVSGAGVPNTFKKLLRRDVAEKSRYYKHVDNLGGSLNMFFFGFDGDLEELGLDAKNHFHFQDSNDIGSSIGSYLNLPADEVPTTKPAFYELMFPSVKDPTYNDRYPGKTLCIMATPANPKWFQQWSTTNKRNRPEDYNTWKEQLTDTMLNILEKHYPQLEGKKLSKDKEYIWRHSQVEHKDMATPLTMNHYLRAQNGSICSLAHNALRMGPQGGMDLRARSDIQGLYLTGQDIASGGIAGALTGALVTAEHILEDHGAKNFDFSFRNGFYL